MMENLGLLDSITLMGEEGSREEKTLSVAEEMVSGSEDDVPVWEAILSWTGLDSRPWIDTWSMSYESKFN